MVVYVKEVAKSADELTMDERNLLSVAYKNVIGIRRASWRGMHISQQREESRGETHHVELVQQYKTKIEAELEDICKDVLSLLTDSLLPKAQDSETKIFYWKMKGDYYRYLAEFATGEKRREAADGAHEAYQQASDLAAESLSPTHPIRLGLALNYSVFYYEIQTDAAKACRLAKQAFDDAISELDSLPEELFRDSKLIMELLRDNLTFWQNDLNTDFTAAVDNGESAAPIAAAPEESEAVAHDAPVEPKAAAEEFEDKQAVQQDTAAPPS